ncbi:50S ribosomal protein L28 [Buchnera aphidicola (Thelaxes suberi)]|uniref:50S ribosomal protein L28 n=1 Tax=Buchnera aphidicola TaxID=9 RepID=UPI0034641CAE
MSHICQITNRKALFGHSRSHAMNAHKKKFLLNLHEHKFWIKEKKKFVKLKISAKGMRFIDKKGIDYVLKKINFFNKNQKKKKNK